MICSPLFSDHHGITIILLIVIRQVILVIVIIRKTAANQTVLYRILPSWITACR